MARTPDNQIERLKQDISLMRLVESHGIPLKKHGKDYLGRCPDRASGTDLDAQKTRQGLSGPLPVS